MAALACLSAATVASAQDIRVDNSNRTIGVSVSETIEVDPEIALVQIGYHNLGKTHEAAYEESGKAAAKIIDALVAAGVPKVNITTEEVALSRVDEETRDSKAPRQKEHQFEARQSWAIRVPVSEAQKVVDLAVAAGANDVQNVLWEVKDINALEAKANIAAVARARGLADQMAEKFGGKVGQLLFVTNNTAALNFNWMGGKNAVAYKFPQIVTVTEAAKPSLTLFPQKVKRDAQVYAVFALE